jgi:hypothetical protein
MPTKIKIFIAFLVVVGTGLTVFPFIPPRDRSMSVEASIKECRGLTKRYEAITYAAYIDQPPSEILFTDGGNKSKKMSEGFKAACTSGKPLRLFYAPVKGSVVTAYRLLGIQGMDGTDYFTVAESIKMDREDNYYAVPVGLGMLFLAFIGLRGAKKKAAGDAGGDTAPVPPRKR